MLYPPTTKRIMKNTISNCVAMIRPSSFAFNAETADNNAFQNKLEHFTPQQIQDIALIEFNNMVLMLQAKGIKVVVFNDSGSDTPDSIFPNNWFSTFTNEIVLYPMYSTNRRKERKKTVFQKISNDLRKPVNDRLVKLEKSNEILEGTGSLVCDYASKTAYAAISPRTTAKALDAFEELTGFTTVRFESQGPDKNSMYHTNVMMTMADTYVILGADTILVSDRADAIANLEKLGKDVISLSNDQVYNHFAGNMLQLKNKKGEKFLVMSKEAHSCLTAEQLDQIQNKHSNEIIAVPIHMIEKIGGGSARCMMAEIFFD